MRATQLKHHAAIIVLSLAITSCGKEAPVPQIRPSTDHVEFKAEGGQTTVTFADGDWCIESVRSGELEMNFSGNIFDENGEQVGTNTWLKLDALGRLENINDGFGLIITRNDPRTLQIAMNENCQNDPHQLIVRLQTGDIYKDLTLTQEKTDGYALQKMEYTVEEGDGDTITNEVDYQHTYITYEDDTVQTGIYLSAHKEVRFTCSSSPKVFNWIDHQKIGVKIPAEVNRNEVIMGNKEVVFKADKTWLRLSKELEDMRHEVIYKKGKNLLTITLEFRARILTYTASFVNKKTGKTRTYSGKYIEKTPTGKKYDVKVSYLGPADPETY